MGHVTIEETFYYIHLIPERLRISPNIKWDMLSSIYGNKEEKIHEKN